MKNTLIADKYRRILNAFVTKSIYGHGGNLSVPFYAGDKVAATDKHSVVIVPMHAGNYSNENSGLLKNFYPFEPTMSKKISIADLESSIANFPLKPKRRQPNFEKGESFDIGFIFLLYGVPVNPNHIGKILWIAKMLGEKEVTLLKISGMHTESYDGAVGITELYERIMLVYFGIGSVEVFLASITFKADALPPVAAELLPIAAQSPERIRELKNSAIVAISRKRGALLVKV